MKITLGLCATAMVASLAMAAPAQAATTTFSLKDIGTFTGYSTANIGQTFTGNGFVGMYDDNEFAHLFGLEGSSSRTNAQVNIASLLGSTITSATLSYTITSNYDTTGTVTITGSGGTGALGYAFNAPTVNYGTATGTTQGTNTADVTNLVKAAAASGNNWLNLFLADSVYSNWTYTSSNSGNYNADSANVRLTVNYTPVAAAVPETATWAMMIVGMGAVGSMMRRRKVVARVSYAA